MAWQHSSPDMMVKRFNKCCISSAMDETDDDMLWNGGEEDENVRRECEGDKGTDYEDRDSDTYL
jgi:hypothetical protein